MKKEGAEMSSVSIVPLFQKLRCEMTKMKMTGFFPMFRPSHAHVAESERKSTEDKSI